MSIVDQIHRTALREDIANVAQALQETVGQRLVAYAVGVRNPKLVGRWARGEHVPRGVNDRRLRELFRVVMLLVEAGETAATVRAWLIGANPQLEDRAPIEVLHEGDPAPVLRAAESFAIGG